MPNYGCVRAKFNGQRKFSSIFRVWVIFYLLSFSLFVSSSVNYRKRMRVVRESMDDAFSRLTTDTYPSPSDQARCDNNYLKLNFVCDPDNFLSHTEAVIINSTLGNKFFHCFHSPSSSNEFAGAGRAQRKNDPRSHSHGAKGEDAIKYENDYSYSPSERRQWSKVVQKRKYTIGIALGKVWLVCILYKKVRKGQKFEVAAIHPLAVTVRGKQRGNALKQFELPPLRNKDGCLAKNATGRSLCAQLIKI
jgi:hypothetical protein